MSVFTLVERAELEAFLVPYGLGRLLEFKGIAEGAENRNFFVSLEAGEYVLTLVERGPRADLPFVLALLQRLHAAGLPVPYAVATQSGESLRELAHDLRALGGHLQVRTGEVPAVLAQLHALQPFARLMSHEETGNAASFERDKAVARWCRAQGVQWQEFAPFGVVRRLASRDQWHAHWAAHTQAAQWPSPAPGTLQFQPAPWERQRAPAAPDLGLHDPDPPRRQRGGRVHPDGENVAITVVPMATLTGRR